MLITPVTILVLVLFLNDYCARDSRNEPSAEVHPRNELCVEGDIQRDDETFLGDRKDDVTFLDVQTDGVTLPVPGSSSSFSLGAVVVVGPRGSQCQKATS